MKILVRSFLRAAVFALVFSCLQLYAQTPEEINNAKDLFSLGEYSDARKAYKDLLNRSNPDDPEIVLPYFKTYLAAGEYSKGLEEVERLLKDNPQSSVLLNCRGKFLTATGKYDQAEQDYCNAHNLNNNFTENNTDLAYLYMLTGKKQKAKELYLEIYDKYLRGEYTSSEKISSAGLAAAYLGEFHPANEAFRTAYRKDKNNIENLNRWARLFYEKYNNADANRTFEEAIEINPYNADLYADYARSVESFIAMEKIAKKALEANPNHVEALNILAELHILDSRYDEAESILGKALDINPSSTLSLANLASVYHLREQTEKYEEIEKRALEINPSCGDYYTRISTNCSMRFRYKDAVEFSRKAVEAEPDNWKASAALGTAELRLGDVNNAREHLDTAFENDPFNLFAKNSLELIDEYKNFDVLESDHFSLKIHNSESVIIGNEILKVAEEAYDSLKTRYNYNPDGKILIEAYNDHADFGVRISGLPNLDLLGVCFGDIVAFDTPKAQESGEYNWAKTLWHELAHVMTIGLSDHRVPRWLTEGLSVYEEEMARPEWARKMDLDIYLAKKHDKLLPLEKINSGFTRPDFPGRIILAYYQSMKIVEFLIKTYGYQVIPELLQGFKERKTMEENFVSVINKKPEEINREFFDYLEKDLKKLSSIAVGLDNISSNQETDTGIKDKMLKRAGNPYFNSLEKGLEYLEENNLTEAEKKFLQALEIYPYFVDRNNPYLKLAQIYRKLEENDKLENILKKYLNVTEYGAAESRELAGLYVKKNEFKEAEKYYIRSIYIEPYERDTYLQLAKIFKAQNIFHKEVEQRRKIVALDPVNKTEAFYNLALSLYNDNRTNDAKKEVLKALEIAPGYKDAQKLLLNCIKTQN
ncbi:tetratricopeptide repeat protein [candidate division KSB1 bacterium]